MMRMMDVANWKTTSPFLKLTPPISLPLISMGFKDDKTKVGKGRRSIPPRVKNRNNKFLVEAGKLNLNVCLIIDSTRVQVASPALLQVPCLAGN
jgi:hypothetical protein